MGQERIPFRPGSGILGAIFMERWCDKCERDRAFRADEGDSCDIAAATMIFRADEPEYPIEWRQDGPQGPRCTAFTLTAEALMSPDDARNQLSLFGGAA